MGLLAVLAGLVAGAISLRFGFAGWPVSRLRLYLLGSAMLILVGVQLMVSWAIMRVLEEINQRARVVSADMDGYLDRCTEGSGGAERASPCSSA